MSESASICVHRRLILPECERTQSRKERQEAAKKLRARRASESECGMILRLIVWQALVGFISTLLVLGLLDLPMPVSAFYLAIPVVVSGVVVWVTARKRPDGIRPEDWIAVILLTLLALLIASYIYFIGRPAMLESRRIHMDAMERSQERERAKELAEE